MQPTLLYSTTLCVVWSASNSESWSILDAIRARSRFCVEDTDAKKERKKKKKRSEAAEKEMNSFLR